jgi:hypothetical protein
MFLPRKCPEIVLKFYENCVLKFVFPHWDPCRSQKLSKISSRWIFLELDDKSMQKYTQALTYKDVLKT